MSFSAMLRAKASRSAATAGGPMATSVRSAAARAWAARMEKDKTFNGRLGSPWPVFGREATGTGSGLDRQAGAKWEGARQLTRRSNLTSALSSQWVPDLDRRRSPRETRSRSATTPPSAPSIRNDGEARHEGGGSVRDPRRFLWGVFWGDPPTPEQPGGKAYRSIFSVCIPEGSQVGPGAFVA